MKILLAIEISICLIYKYKKENDWSCTHTQTLFERVLTVANAVSKILIVPTFILVMFHNS